MPLPTTSRLRARLLLVSALLVGLVAPAEAQDLDSVVERREAIEDDLSQATAAYEDLWGRVEAGRAELEELQERTAELEAEAAAVDRILAERARTVFMRGSDTVLASLMSADGPAGAIERAALMSAVTSRDQGRLEGAVNLRIQLKQSRELLADKTAELEAMSQQLEVHREQLETQLASTKRLESDLRARDARKRRIQRGVQNGTYACIFERGTTRFRNTWGAPRSGGRSHQGTDVFSYYGAPVFAFTSGRIHRISTSRLGGLGLYLWGDDSRVYYYAHLSGIADGIRPGRRVEAGELVAYNGDSGNARGGAPHVHFEMHPGGGRAVNPYEWLAAACF